MPFEDEFKQSLLSVTPDSFESLALEAFQFQYQHNPLYHQYVNLLKTDVRSIQSVTDIPFLPISFYKKHQVMTGKWSPSHVFKSSGTTQSKRSSNPIKDAELYKHLAKQTFEHQYGPLRDYNIYALLPSYQEQKNSSLLFMIDYFINEAADGIYVDSEDLTWWKSAFLQPSVLVGVSYALLDLLESSPAPNSELLIIETGGMKGRRKELTRSELHQQIRLLGPEVIHSEYGMTELMSQAYGASGKFTYPHWAKAYIREINDPLSLHETGSGALNVVDLANIDTCCFIATEDMARCENDYFEILGRTDNSDIRGCNLLVV